ncbi:MAG TPA: hypothetical protein VHA52_10725 [Candidatus Babeliaceae bacterium]|nr:hypothetical protein [Candidatus Babeliaceae bacterium]
MKRFNFLLTAIILVLTITTAVSCTTMAGTEDGYYDGQRVYGNRVYIDDPNRGTIVLERDPWTGRYYEVGGYNPYYGYGNRYYGRGYRTYGRTYRENSSEYHNRNNSGNYRKNNPSPEQYKKDRDDARNKILGKH